MKAVGRESKTRPEPTLEKYLRLYYCKVSEPSKDEWPPSFNIEYINLVLVQQKRKPPAKSRAEKSVKFATQGQIERIDGKRLALKDVLTSAEKNRVTIINGAPGVGKTTLVKKLRKDWANKALLTEFYLTFYIPLREPAARLSENIHDLLNYYGDKCNEADRELIESKEGEGILFILDGWDELRQSCRGKQQLFPKLISGSILPGCNIIVTSRPGTSMDIIGHANRIIEVLGFTKDQVKEYIHAYFKEEEEEEEEEGREGGGAQKLISELETYSSIASTCYIPVNLAIVCYVYHALDYNLPPTLTEVFQWFIIHTVLRYLKKKKVIDDIKAEIPQIDKINDFFASSEFNDSVKKSFNDSLMDTLNKLGKLAINGLKNDDLCFSRKDLVSTCGINEEDTQFDGYGILKPIHISHCVGAEPFYHFLHLSIQEFMAAFYISQLRGSEQMKWLQIDNERYSAVIKYFCGINQFQSQALRILFMNKTEFELFHLECIHEGQWYDHCKEIAKCCSNTFRFDDQNLQPHQWGVLSYIMEKSGTQWMFTCTGSILEANGMSCFNKHLSENNKVLHQLCLSEMYIYDYAYEHLARTCQTQVALTELDIVNCNLTDDGVFTIFKALEGHPSLQTFKVHDNSVSAHVIKAFLKLLPTLPALQSVDVNISKFSDRDYCKIVQCVSNCSSPPDIIVPNDPGTAAVFSPEFSQIGTSSLKQVKPSNSLLDIESPLTKDLDSKQIILLHAHGIQFYNNYGITQKLQMKN